MGDSLTAEEAYRRGLYFLPLHAPMVPIRVQNTLKDQKEGPCVLLLRNQEPPPLDGLECTPAYSLGVAIRFIGFALDELSTSPDKALEIFGELVEAADAHMRRYRAGACAPYTVSDLVDDLFRAYGEMFAFINVRDEVERYVAYALTMEPKPGNRHEFIDPSIEQSCAEMVGSAPTYHLPGDVYDQSEISTWPIVRMVGPFIDHDVFVLQVDGETWRPLVDDPSVQAQTDWLLVDMRQPYWRLYERVKSRGIGIRPGSVHINGVVLNPRSGETRAIETTQFYVPADGKFQRLAQGPMESGRIVRVAVTFLLMMRSSRVRVKPFRRRGAWKVRLPRGWTVDEIVDDVLRRGQSA